MEIEIVIAVILLLAMVFLATVDGAFSHLSDVGLRRISTDDESLYKKESVKFLREILENRPRFRFAISSAIQVLLIAFTVLVTVIVAEFTPSRTRLLIFSMILCLAGTVVFRQIIPRLLVRENTERKLLLILPAIRPVYRLVSFFAEPIAVRAQNRSQRQKLDATIAPDANDERIEEKPAEDFQALMEVGEAEGIIEEKEREMIETMVEFGDTRAGEIMTPRTEIVGLPIESTVRSARDLIIEEKYSRLPVYRESMDTIEGFLYVRDLLQAWADGKEDMPVADLLRDAFFVPETRTAADLLKDMQLNHVQIAVVIDEYGGVAGLVTVEDLLEEIVGEIEDEDTEEDEIVEIVEGEGGYYDVLGSTEINKIERLFDLDLEDEEYTTIAGMVICDVGHLPKTGQTFDLRGMLITVLKADDKKIRRLRLRRTQ